MLRWLHGAYRAQQAEAEHTSTAILEVEERRYRQRGWLSRHDRAQHRALREQLQARGVEVPPLVLAPAGLTPGLRGLRRVVR